MTDREKLVIAIKRAKEQSEEYGLDRILVDFQAADMILKLLEEQEAVAPIPPTDESDLWKCGNCNHQLFRCTHQRYCDKCGKAVKWNKINRGDHD